MAGATPWLGAPYPVGTDPVTSGDNVMQAIAEFLEGTAWVYPALLNGWTTQPMPHTLGYRRDGVGNVHIVGDVTIGTVTMPAFTLPVGYRPVANSTGFAPDILTGNSATWAVATSGTLTGSLPGARYQLDIVFSTKPRT
jgi:hypothetical protein